MNLELSILLCLFALSVGSFVNSFIYRFPLIISEQDLNLFKPRSFCPKCKTRLKPFMLIPIISYIYLKGKCGFCKEKIEISYPLNEVIHLLIMVVVLFIVPIGINSIIVFVLFSILYTQMILDYKHFLLSISLNALLIVTGLVLNYGFNYFTSFEESILGMVIPNKGNITVLGENIKQHSDYRHKIDYLPQIANFPSNLRVKELIKMIKDLRKPTHEDERLIQLFKLEPFLDKN